jgi:TRAP-type C4-dicarboxylate transport system substrate-binding protein
MDGFTLNSIITLPFMGWPGQLETDKIYQELLNKFPEMKAEWKGVMPYVQCMMPPSHIHNVKKVIKTPSDLKGMRFHSESASMQVISSAGGTPVDLDIADMYMSLDRGLIDGVVNHFPVLFVFGVLKILEYHTMVGEGGINMVPIGIIWNEEKWKSLPPDIQKKIMGVRSVFSKIFYAGDIGLQKKTIGDSKSFGHKFKYLTPDEVKVWYNLVKEPIHDRWIQEADAKGLPGKAVYNAALDMLK